MPIFQQNHLRIHYQKFGGGKKVILAFHGFSRSSDDYLLYKDLIDKDYQCYALDLFYHGKTKLDGRKLRVLNKQQLRELMCSFMAEMGIEQFSVMGYSMGGRMALFCLEQYPSKIDKLVLLAPDGLKVNLWNWLIVNTKTGKNIYGFTIHHPAWMKVATKTGTRLGLLPEKLEKFLHLNFGTKGMRLRVYRVFKLFKEITFDQKVLLSNIKDHQIETHAVIGTKDPVVNPSIVKDFAKKVPEFINYHELSAGHDLFKPHVVEYVGEKVL